MRSTITNRGQTVIPAAIRRQFNLTPADRLEWVVENNNLRVIPVKKNLLMLFEVRGKVVQLKNFWPIVEKIGSLNEILSTRHISTVDFAR